MYTTSYMFLIEPFILIHYKLPLHEYIDVNENNMDSPTADWLNIKVHVAYIRTRYVTYTYDDLHRQTLSNTCPFSQSM